jgi:hypothetical protein
MRTTTTRRTARAAGPHTACTPHPARTVGLLAASVLAAGAMAACTPDEPAPQPTTAQHTSTPTPTPTPMPTVAMPAPVPSPTRPVEWLDDGEAGAEESALYFLELYRYTQSTQDTGPWEAISDPECVFCQSVLDDVATRRGEGQVVMPAEIVTSPAQVRQLNATAFSVDMSVDVGPDQVWSADGQLLDAGAPGHAEATFLMVRNGDVWIVRGVSFGQE